MDTAIPEGVTSDLQAPSRTIRPERAAPSSWEVNVEIAASQLPRIVRLALIGAATAFAWIVVSLVLGFGLGHAHADDLDDGGVGGALGAVATTVDSAATTVTDTVAPVTQVVETVVAVAPAPVQQPVSQSVETARSVVTGVTQPVSEAVSGGVVTGVTEPVVDLVAATPIIGDVATGIGLDDAVADIGGTVDDTLGDVVGAVDEAGAHLGRPSTGGPDAGPLLPGIPGLLPPSGDAAIGSATVLPSAGADASTALFSTAGGVRDMWLAASRSVTAAISAAVASSAALVVSGLVTAAGGLCLPMSSAGPGGAGPGVWALAALLPLAAHRAWVRRAGPEDEHAPPAPAGSTDVSPD
jgi:hypothetical protein